VRGYELLWQRYRSGNLPIEHVYAFVTVPITAVPRLVWPSKPVLAYENRWTYNLFGEISSTSAEEGVGVWTFTVWGEGLTQFGLIGIPLVLFAYGLFVG
jgi:hypothetical protein